MAPPPISLVSVTNITSTTAQSGGASISIMGLGGFNLTAKGICWSHTNTIPTISDSSTNEFIGDPTTNDFVSIMTGLSPNTLYYVRAYRTTDKPDTSYSNNVLTFTTLTSVTHKVVTIGARGGTRLNGKKIILTS